MRKITDPPQKKMTYKQWKQWTWLGPLIGGIVVVVMALMIILNVKMPSNKYNLRPAFWISRVITVIFTFKILYQTIDGYIKLKNDCILELEGHKLPTIKLIFYLIPGILLVLTAVALIIISLYLKL